MLFRSEILAVLVYLLNEKYWINYGVRNNEYVIYFAFAFRYQLKFFLGKGEIDAFFWRPGFEVLRPVTRVAFLL